MSHPSRCRQQRFHKSPFLRLPREIRDLNYRTALVSSTPIDLCPANYAESNPETNLEEYQQRYLNFTRENDKRINRVSSQDILSQNPLLAFRLQDDIQSVRTMQLSQSRFKLL